MVFQIINFCGFETFCNADMYADTYVAKLMWEQKTLFPVNWVFGNQYYVLATPVLAAVFYGLTGSMNLSMVLATTAMTVLILVTFVWMLRPFANRAGLLTGTVLLVGSVMGPEIVYTTEGQIFYLMASYYAVYLITLFVVFGSYIRDTAEISSRRISLRLILSMFLSFCTGMQSLRQTAMMVLPLLAMEGLRCLRRIRASRRLRGALTPCTWRVLAVSAANLMGYALIRWLNPPSVTIYGSLDAIAPDQISTHLSTALRALRSTTGLKYLLAEPRCIPLGILALLLVAVVIGVCLLKEKNRSSDALFQLYFLFLFSIAATLGSSLVLDIALRGIYLFSWYPLVAVSGVILFRRLHPKWSLVLSVFLAANLWCSYGANVRSALSPDTSIYAQIADYLLTTDYSILYGEWYSTSGICAKTDGAVAAGSWADEPFQILGYINPQDIYSESDNANALYLLTPGCEQAALEYAQSQGAALTPVASFWDGSYTLYSSSKQLMH